MSKILIIDDEQGIRIVLTDVLKDEGFSVKSAERAADGMALLKSEKFDLVILDVWLPDANGIDLLQEITEYDSQLPTVVISGHANLETAAKATTLGAFDFLEKPLTIERTLNVANNAIAFAKLKREKAQLVNAIEDAISKEQVSEIKSLLQSAIDNIEKQRTALEAYLFLGPEKGKKQERIDKIIAEKSNGGKEQVDLFKFYPFSDEVSAIVNVASNGSLFSSWQIIILNQCEEYKSKEGSAFVELIKENAPTVLIFCSDENSESKIDSSIVKQIPKQNREIFWEMFESNKRGWIVEFLQKRKIRIEKEAVDFLLEVLENNTEDFKATCEQIAIAYGEGAHITSAMLEEYLYHSKEENVYSLFEKIAYSDFQGALEIFNKLVSSATVAYPQLIGGILWQLKNLLEWVKLKEENYSVDEIATKLNVRAKKAKAQMQQAASCYSAQNIHDMIVLTTRADSILRESKSDIQLLIGELFIYFLIIKKGDTTNFERTLTIF